MGTSPAEVLILQIAGELVLPSLAGTIPGGTGLFALLAAGQVQEELQPCS